MRRAGQKTQSEELFEQFCAEHGLRCEPIPREPGRTPDYDVYFAERQVIAEVTTISALGVLIENPEGQPTLTFYHNRYAAIPFEPDWFRAERVKHYKTSSTQANEFGGWIPA